MTKEAVRSLPAVLKRQEPAAIMRNQEEGSQVDTEQHEMNTGLKCILSPGSA